MSPGGRGVLLLAISLLLAGWGWSCASRFDDPGSAGLDAGPGEPGSGFHGAGVGQSCQGDLPCRDGLVCLEGRCRPAGRSKEGEKCLLDAECSAGLTCGWSGFCTPAGEGGENASCSSSSDCLPGFYCATSGLAGFCAAAPLMGRDLDQPCSSTADCLGGLQCSAASHRCLPGSLLLNPELFPGTPCPEQEEREMPFGVRTVIPRPGQPAVDFYTLPFPNDIRRQGGRLQLADHPRPGPGLLGTDVVGAVLDGLQAEASGFALSPAVYFRFTRPVDPASLSADGEAPSLRFVDLDGGGEQPFFFRLVDRRNKYICANHLLVHPRWSSPLAAGRTYAVLVTSGVRASPVAEHAAGAAARPLDDLPLLLGETPPAGAKERVAWETYTKLRRWLGGAGLAGEHVAGAAVFTTGDPVAEMRQLRDAVQGSAIPELVAGSVTVCRAGTRSPCATAGWSSTPEGAAGQRDPRDCPAEPPRGMLEVHALLRVPYFQEGERPYLDGGGALRRVAGRITVVGTEDVCLGLALPTSAPPAEGWPLLLYGHGTGGSFRSAAEALAALPTLQGVAMLSLDQPLHGARSRVVAPDPGPLVYNYGNPPATKGNLMQGAADGLSLLRFARSYRGEIAGVGKVRFAAGRIVWAAHSQGSTSGAMLLPFAEGVRGAVLSGVGGALVHGLLGKKEPYDASVGVRVGLQELEMDPTHPALHLLQAYFEPIDSLFYAPLLYRQPEGDALHVLQVLGWDDSFTPWQSGLIFAAATGGALAQPQHRPPALEVEAEGLDPVADLAMSLLDLPISGNVAAGEKAITGVTTAYTSDGTYDGHFVIYHDPTAMRQVAEFLSALLAGGDRPPTIPAPE